MSGEVYALLAALSYGFAGVTIAKGKSTACGDNGVYLSVLVTAGVSAALWLEWGQSPINVFMSRATIEPLTVFVAAGVFSMVLGRTTMYRATESIGPVAASLLRRLTPVFALPIAIIFLAEIPSWGTLFGAGLVIVAVLIYIGKPAAMLGRGVQLGWALGVGSAAFYAMSYTLRSHGLDQIPDPALGTFIGAFAGLIWLLIAAIVGSNSPKRLIVDRGRWHWLSAAALSAGQIFQFFALTSASVVVVATLGSLEVFFTAAFGSLLLDRTKMEPSRIWGATGIATVGTAILMW